MLNIHMSRCYVGLALLGSASLATPAWGQSTSGIENASCNASFKRSCVQSSTTTTQATAPDAVATAPLPDLGGHGAALMLALFAAAILALGRRTT